jgi:alpha-mannosidase
MRITAAQSTDLFTGSPDRPLQVVRVTVAEPGDTSARLRVEGNRITVPEPVDVPRSDGKEVVVEVPIAVDATARPGETLAVEVVLEPGGRHQIDVMVEEPGWTVFMIPHFHYDPVWWNTQAAYTETWVKGAWEWEAGFQSPGFPLVAAHLDAARRDPDYAFVLAELDYLKPYWDAHPEDRAYMRQLLDEGRLELVGGTYNEPNTNLTASETTIRNLVYGVGYQRDVMGGDPATAWQLDAFGHDPQFPGLAASAGLTSSSWARGPFHAWGPYRMPPTPELARSETRSDEPPRVQFPSEFEWMAPSGAKLLTCYMADHYSSGWWMDAAADLAQAEAETYACYLRLKAVAATKNVLLPVGSDYTPPNKWVTEIARDWNSRYLSPHYVVTTPRRFFAAVREEAARERIHLRSQTRDMNPLYTGKDVSFIDTKQANRLAENVLLDAEAFATIASLRGARYPTEAIDKAWRQLLFNAHHDGITGSESDQVYLDLLGGWREAWELGLGVLDASLAHIGTGIDTTGEGRAVVAFNPTASSRTDLGRLRVEFAPGMAAGIEVRDGAGASIEVLVDSVSRHPDNSIEQATVTFIATDVPSLGYRLYRLLPTDRPGPGWSPREGNIAESDRYLVEADPERGGSLVRLYDKRADRELLSAGEVGNELLAYGEYSTHPYYGEGPWHLVPDGRAEGTAASGAQVTVERCAIGERVTVLGTALGCRYTQETLLWNGLDRIEFRTHLDGFSGEDTLFRVRFPVDVEGAMPVSGVAGAVVGRTFGFPSVDVAEVPFTLDYPAYDWFGLSSCVKVELGEDEARAISVAEVVIPSGPDWGELGDELAAALVKQGVTSTVSTDDDGRYGLIDLDSNLPDARISVGGPEMNKFSAAALESADPGLGSGLRRRVSGGGSARVWVPAEAPLQKVWSANPDLRDPRALPALIVAGDTPESTAAAVRQLLDDLGDGTVTVDEVGVGGAGSGRVEDYGVAVMNRGNPGFNVDPYGALHLSMMRSCSGWPSGIWIDPPRRTLPDGGNFQFQRWSHTFEYALTGFAGDWRSAGIPGMAQAYNRPFHIREIEAHSGDLTEEASFLEIEPPSVLLSALKPLGNPMASQAGTEADPGQGLLVRLQESGGRPTEATVRAFIPLSDAFRTDVLEEQGDPLEGPEGGVAVSLGGFEIAGVGATPGNPPDPPVSELVQLGPRAEPAQPVFAAYWLHNKGAAPLGYQPVTVRVSPRSLWSSGPFSVDVAVASERTDVPVAGQVELRLPPGWSAEPAERMFRLAPGAHLKFSAEVTPPVDAASGRYFVAARVEDEGGQVHEDVVTVEYRSNGVDSPPEDGSELRVDRATGKAVVTTPEPVPPELRGDLEVQLRREDLRLRPGERGEIVVELRNRTLDEVRGELQVISPFDTWEMITPWTTGFALGGSEESSLAVAVHPPRGARPAEYWALVKVMYFGRLHYTEALRVIIEEEA